MLISGIGFPYGVGVIMAVAIMFYTLYIAKDELGKMERVIERDQSRHKGNQLNHNTSSQELEGIVENDISKSANKLAESDNNDKSEKDKLEILDLEGQFLIFKCICGFSFFVMIVSVVLILSSVFSNGLSLWNLIFKSIFFVVSAYGTLASFVRTFEINDKIKKADLRKSKINKW